jgi:pimeloyl-ACP methyl ester carboxylesterase/DNA-binding CsgD family transcriptional regulator
LQPLSQHVRFCTAPDGTTLAYAALGKGLPLVRAAHWLTHLDFDRQSRVWRPFVDALARDFTFVRYDQRGSGLSDRHVNDISAGAWLADLETVADAAGLKRFALLGMSQGAAIAIEYAVRHPERVTKLVLYGGYARGRRRRNDPREAEEADLQERAILLGWGRENPAFRQIFTSQFMPDASREQMDDWDAMQRVSTSAECAAAIVRATSELDVTALLPQVTVPTLVVHSEADARVPFAEGRLLASAIPGARFVPLPSRSHVLLDSEPAFQIFLEEVRGFLQDGTQPESLALASLTVRERQILDRIARGRSNDEIAAEIGVSPKTVRNVVSILFDKLGVTSRAQAIVKAREAGFGRV